MFYLDTIPLHARRNNLVIDTQIINKTSLQLTLHYTFIDVRDNYYFYDD